MREESERSLRLRSVSCRAKCFRVAGSARRKRQEAARRCRSKGNAPRHRGGRRRRRRRGRYHHGSHEIFHNRLSDDACVIRE